MSQMSEKPKEAVRNKGLRLHELSVVLELTIVLGAAIWLIYDYLPQYYLPLSFTLLVLAGVFAYVILSKVIKF